MERLSIINWRIFRNMVTYLVTLWLVDKLWLVSYTLCTCWWLVPFCTGDLFWWFFVTFFVTGEVLWLVTFCDWWRFARWRFAKWSFCRATWISTWQGLYSTEYTLKPTSLLSYLFPGHCGTCTIVNKDVYLYVCECILVCLICIKQCSSSWKDRKRIRIASVPQGPPPSFQAMPLGRNLRRTVEMSSS
jgi:hypothetical protein